MIKLFARTWRCYEYAALLLLALLLLPASVSADRLRLIIETDAGGDPDDEQSLVRFLLYANEWDVEGIIANRPEARPRENRNPERTGLGIVRRLVKAYGESWTNLVQHDARYPSAGFLWERTVAGSNDSDAGVALILRALDRPDPRPLWYSDWGTDNGAATNNLKRALDRILRERGQASYAQCKAKLRLSSADKFGEHTSLIAPPFPFWVDTFRPEIDRRRWYHRFSALTATAAGFDLQRDVLTGHGPLGALYPTNTTHWQKEGDTMTFLYLVPNGMNDPEHPAWGSWAGRYGQNENYPAMPYYWANQADSWQGTTNRDNTLKRWAAALQNDFRARLDWCVQPRQSANHPPVARVAGDLRRRVPPSSTVTLDGSSSTDPDGQALSFQWEIYREASACPEGVRIENPNYLKASVILPDVSDGTTVHVILTVTDDGMPKLSRYQRVILTVNK